MNWRQWIYDVLLTDQKVVDLGSHVYPISTMRSVPTEVQFVTYGFRPSARGPFPGSQIVRLVVWAHDKADSYTRIDDVLQSVRATVEAAGANDQFISAEWESFSQDSEDDGLGTLTRNAAFRLAAIKEMPA